MEEKAQLAKETYLYSYIGCSYKNTTLFQNKNGITKKLVLN